MKVLESGQKLRDTHYGPGVVLNSDPEYTTIRFRNFGTKKYVTSLLQMELVEAPKPVKPQAAARRSAPKPIAKSMTMASARHAKPSGKSRNRAARPERSRPRPLAKRKRAGATRSALRKRSRR